MIVNFFLVETAYTVRITSEVYSVEKCKEDTAPRKKLNQKIRLEVSLEIKDLPKNFCNY